MQQFNTEEYQTGAARTCATPSAEPCAMYENGSILAQDLLTFVVYSRQADLGKRSLFYRAPIKKLEEKSNDYKVDSDNLYDLLDKVKESEPNRKFTEEQLNVLHAGIGLFTEAGEILEAVLKSYLSGEPLDKNNLIEEGGDAMWYTALLFNTIKSNFTEAGSKNLNKLIQRYPEKFSEFNALNRDLEKEAEALK